jgi:hypothetical protein
MCSTIGSTAAGCTRTRSSRFLCWNMNYHVEHHMFPMVPYYALPALREEMKADAPRPYRGFLEAYREIIPAVFRQVKEPSDYVKPKLPRRATLHAADAIRGNRGGRVGEHRRVSCSLPLTSAAFQARRGGQGRSPEERRTIPLPDKWNRLNCP